MSVIKVKTYKGNYNKIYNFTDILDDIKTYFNKYGKIDIKIVYSWIRQCYLYKNNRNCNLLNKFDKNYKYKDKYRLFKEYFQNKVFEIIKDLDDSDDLENNISIYKNEKKLDKERERWYKLNNILFPHKRINEKTDKYTLKNGLKFNPIDSIIKNDYNCSEIIAYDTETYKGYCKLICDNNGRKLYINNQDFKTENTFFKIIRFLKYHLDKKEVYRFWFNIDYDIQAILKHLDYKNNKKHKRKIDDLKHGIKVIFIDTENNKPYQLSWLKGVSFTIKDIKRNRCIIFTDLWKFYNLGLGLAGSIYLGNTKYDKVDSKKLNTDLIYWSKNLKNIEKYCIIDCQITQQLGWLLVNSIKESGLKLPQHLYSSASISKINYRFNNWIPSIRDNVSMKLVQIGYDCYYGGRFELFKRGTFKKTWLFDINSQYPSIIKDLPDMRNGFWYKYKDLNELPKNKTFGYFRCKIKIPYDCYIPTLPNIKERGKYVNGVFNSWFTWFDLDLMRDYIIEINKAYIFVPNKDNTYPFRSKTLELYEKKSKLKNGSKMMYNTVKITLNGIYGCFIEKHEEFSYNELTKDYDKRLIGGKCFNPIYASQITSYGHWSVLKPIPKSEWNSLIAIHTDSIITNKDVSCYLDIGKELGQWSLEGKGKGWILNTGFYQIGKGKKKILKTRGVPKKYVNDIPKLLKKYKNESEIPFTIKHMVKMCEAIIQDKDIINMNIMRDQERKISINSDDKRHWNRDFKDFKDFLKNNIDSLSFVNFNENIENFEINPNPIIISKELGYDLEKTEYILKKQDIY